MATPQGVLDIGQNGLRQFSELSGGRKVRDFDLYHFKPYAAAGQASIEFFRASGLQQDLSGVYSVEVSNMVQSGKFDEPFLLLGISVLFQPFDTTDANQVTDVEKILFSGQLVLEINNTQVYTTTPIGMVGSPLALEGYASTGSSGATAGLYNKLMPKKFSLPIYCEEGLTLRAAMLWTTVQTCTTASRIGIYLHGQKFFKG